MTARHSLGLLALAAAVTLALPIPAAALHAVSPGGAAPNVGAQDLLPDLRMADLYDIHLQRGRKGELRLRFGTIVWNLGQGPLEARMTGRDGRKMTDVRQVIRRSDGTTRDVVLPDMWAFYTGDGHDHWHLPGFVVVVMAAIPRSGQPVPTEIRRLRKIGFCLTDNYPAPSDLRPPNSAPSLKYSWTGCGTRGSANLRMGISVGWGDEYKEWFPHQAVVVSGVPAGNYRLCATADKGSDWAETDDTNNSSWTDIEMNPTKMTVKVLAHGEGDCSVPPAP